MKKDDLIIIRSDGGICSQIYFAAYAKYFIDKGFKVKYDLSWFREFGTGMDGRFLMPYMMNKAFPEIKIDEAAEEEIKLYKAKYHYKNKSVNEIKPPMYIDGYPKERAPLFIKSFEYFKNNFNPVDISECSEILEKIKSENSCAVHVRRGDLSAYLEGYGYPPEKDYFINALKIIKAFCPDVRFYFFSDETDWIGENIIPFLDGNTNYEIIDKNPTEKGYLDLYLMANAKYIISSQGSMGHFAKVLSKNNPLLILSKNESLIIKNFDNCIYLNEDESLKRKYKKIEPEKTFERKTIKILGIKISYKRKIKR